MKDRNRILLLIMIMVLAVILVGGASIMILWKQLRARHV